MPVWFGFWQTFQNKLYSTKALGKVDSCIDQDKLWQNQRFSCDISMPLSIMIVPIMRKTWLWQILSYKKSRTLSKFNFLYATFCMIHSFCIIPVGHFPTFNFSLEVEQIPSATIVPLVLIQGFFSRDFPATNANGFSEILSYWQKFLELWGKF